MARFGQRFDAQGVLAGSRDASRCIGYLTKYLTKHVADCHQAQTAPSKHHADRLVEALRYEPCSPRCANWLRYGIQPKNPRPGMRPGHCQGKAHRREYLGYAGRRVLVSRKWSGKTLADHRADRKAWLLTTLGIPAADPARYTWEPVTPGDPDHMPPAQRLLHVVADRQRWHAALTRPEPEPAANSPPIFRQPGRPHDRTPGHGQELPQHRGGMTVAELLALPVVVDITTAARALGLGRSTGYELAQAREFPCRVLRVGSSTASQPPNCSGSWASRQTSATTHHRQRDHQPRRHLDAGPDPNFARSAQSRSFARWTSKSCPRAVSPYPAPCSCSTSPAARKSRSRWVSTLVDMPGTRAASSR